MQQHPPADPYPACPHIPPGATAPALRAIAGTPMRLCVDCHRTATVALAGIHDAARVHGISYQLGGAR